MPPPATLPIGRPCIWNCITTILRLRFEFNPPRNWLHARKVPARCRVLPFVGRGTQVGVLALAPSAAISTSVMCRPVVVPIAAPRALVVRSTHRPHGCRHYHGSKCLLLVCWSRVLVSCAGRQSRPSVYFLILLLYALAPELVLAL